MDFLSLNLELPTFSQLRHEQAAERAKLDRREKRRALRRSYDAARVNRLNKDFSVVNTSSNFELRRSLRYLRARSRNLARNNDYAKKFFSMVRNNVAGPTGMKLQVRARDNKGELDQVLNRTIEQAWKQWCHKETASLNGKLSWTAIQRKHINAVARDGEALLRIFYADNPFGFALKFYGAAWLDETYNERLQNGNRVIMSVEVDDNDRPVAYWLTPPPEDYLFLDSNAQSRFRTRVPAEEIIHSFLMDDENSDDDVQVRGVPWIHTAITRLNILGAYEEAELVAARVGACKMGFFKEEMPEDDEYIGDEDDDDASNPPLMDSAQPGQFGIIPSGYDFTPYDPTHPNTSYPAFIKGCLLGISAGMDVGYSSLTNDRSGETYSSGRITLLSERDTWRGLQYFQVEELQRRVFLGWLKAAMLAGAINIRAADYKRLQEPLFQPRGWRWIDPYKEIQAAKLAVDEGFDTRTDVIGEQGGDFEEKMTTLAHEQKVIKEKGLVLGSKESKPSPAPDSDEEESDGQKPSRK